MKFLTFATLATSLCIAEGATQRSRHLRVQEEGDSAARAVDGDRRNLIFSLFKLSALDSHVNPVTFDQDVNAGLRSLQGDGGDGDGGDGEGGDGDGGDGEGGDGDGGDGEGGDGDGGDGEGGDGDGGDGEGGDGDGGDGEGGDGDGGDGDGGDGEGGDGDGGDGDGGDGDGGDGDGGDGGGGDGGGITLCFSGLSTVKLEDGSTISMKDLKIGDRVQVTENGKFDTVYSFGHFEPDSFAEFLSIQSTTTASPITISAPHMLFLNSGNAVPASYVKVGDSLRGGETVTKVDKVTLKGAYAPFTYTGTIVVDDVVASNYVSLTGTNTLFGIDMHFMSHTSVTALRMIFQQHVHKESYTEEGIASWIPYHAAAWVAAYESEIACLVVLFSTLAFIGRRRRKMV